MNSCLYIIIYLMLFLHKFDLVDVLLFFAIVAGEDAVGHVEMGGHGLVVGDALGVVAFHDAFNLLRGLDGLLLNDLVVTDDVEDNFRGHDGETRNLVVGEKLVADLDDTLIADFLRGVVITDGDGSLQVEKS